MIVRHHGQAACHRLDRHIPKGLGQTRENKQICTRVMFSQIQTGARTRKNRFRNTTFEGVTQGAISNDDQLHWQTPGLQGFKTTHDGL